MSWDKKHGFNTQKLALNVEYEGQAEATLIERKAGTSSKKAVLYIHGFVDYFFQNHLADWANNLNFNFYAIDLRKHGRSMLPHQSPNMVRDIRDYFEELEIAIDIIRNQNNNEFIALIGHSTGGLISSLYAHFHANDNTIDALILNSPFFDFNKPRWFKNAILPIVAKVGLRLPNLASPEGLKEGYVKSIHKDHNGEWKFSFDHKPVLGFKINFGWIAAIYYAQKSLQSGLDIECPTLVMYSSKSVIPGNYNSSMHTADSVLDVADIEKHADVIGKNVKKIVIKDGVHDLILSKKEVRENVFSEMTIFINEVLNS